MRPGTFDRAGQAAVGGNMEESTAKHVKTDAPEPEDAEKDTERRIPTAVWVVVAAVCLAVGVAIGHFLLGGSTGTISLNGRTTLSASELDSVIATYTMDGVTHDVTARDVLTFGGTELTANEDGTYPVPGANSVVSYVQTLLMLEEAEARGVAATDEEVDEWLATHYNSDIASYAANNGISEDSARELFRMYVTIENLGENVVGEEYPTMPTEPEAPADGAEETPTAEYAEYVIGLVGDEWDSDANTWARTDGEYYATLSSYEISNDSATYAAASAAYSVAMMDYQEAYTASVEKQNAFTDELFSKVSIQIGTLLSN